MLKLQWKKVKDRKWEMKLGDRVVATIFHRPQDDKYSLFVAAPKTYRKVRFIDAESHFFDSFESAVAGLADIIKNEIAPYAHTMMNAALVGFETSIIEGSEDDHEADA
jgi:hypothetical protein